MEIKDLKKISISNLILIILNDKNIDVLRKCAEAELRERVKYVGWEFDDLLHFDDKVIQKRGLDVNNYCTLNVYKNSVGHKFAKKYKFNFKIVK